MKEYGDNIAQLEVEKEHLQGLEEEKDALMQKYLPGCKSVDILKDINSYLPGPKNKKRTPFDDFMIELEDKKILENINKCNERIKQLELRIKKMEEPLKKIKGYEKKIYLYVLNGNNVSKAVSKVAEEADISERQMWKYYKKLKIVLDKHGIKLKNEIFL